KGHLPELVVQCAVARSADAPGESLLDALGASLFAFASTEPATPYALGRCAAQFQIDRIRLQECLSRRFVHANGFRDEQEGRAPTSGVYPKLLAQQCVFRAGTYPALRGDAN